MPVFVYVEPRKPSSETWIHFVWHSYLHVELFIYWTLIKSVISAIERNSELLRSRDVIHWEPASFWCRVHFPVLVIITVLKKKKKKGVTTRLILIYMNKQKKYFVLSVMQLPNSRRTRFIPHQPLQVISCQIRFYTFKQSYFKQFSLA